RKRGRLAPILTPKKQCKPGQKPPNFSKCAKPYQAEKARKDTSFRAFWKTFWEKSALGELRSATGSLEAVLLALLHARIAGQVAGLLQDGAVLLVLLQHGAADAVADGAGLAGNAAAGHADHHVELILDAQQDQRSADDQLQGLQAEVVVQITVVDGDLAGAGVHANAGNGILTTTSAVEIRFGFVHIRLPPS